MKSPQQRAESAARALRREGFFQPHPALDSEAASIILRETGLERLVDRERQIDTILTQCEKLYFELPPFPIPLSEMTPREVEIANVASVAIGNMKFLRDSLCELLSKLTPPEA